MSLHKAIGSLQHNGDTFVWGILNDWSSLKEHIYLDCMSIFYPFNTPKYLNSMCSPCFSLPDLFSPSSH